MAKMCAVPFTGTKEQEEALLKVIEELKDTKGALMPIMQKAQDIYGYLPYEVQKIISDNTGVPIEKIYGVATFYENFSLEPKGKYVIRCCDGTACHVRGSLPILNKLREILGLSEDKITTDDLNFTVETVSCLGACGLAPVLTVNGKVYPAMTPEKAAALVNELKKQIEEEA